MLINKLFASKKLLLGGLLISFMSAHQGQASSVSRDISIELPPVDIVFEHVKKKIAGSRGNQSFNISYNGNNFVVLILTDPKDGSFLTPSIGSANSIQAFFQEGSKGNVIRNGLQYNLQNNDSSMMVVVSPSDLSFDMACSLSPALEIIDGPKFKYMTISKPADYKLQCKPKAEEKKTDPKN